MRIIIYRRILFQIKRMEGAENRSVKSLFIYFKNCESNSFIILYIHAGTRDRILNLKRTTRTQKIIFFVTFVRLINLKVSFLIHFINTRTYIQSEFLKLMRPPIVWYFFLLPFFLLSSSIKKIEYITRYVSKIEMNSSI